MVQGREKVMEWLKVNAKVNEFRAHYLFSMKTG